MLDLITASYITSARMDQYLEQAIQDRTEREKAMIRAAQMERVSREERSRQMRELLRSATERTGKALRRAGEWLEARVAPRAQPECCG